jgi:hypothetical protein
MGAHFDNITYTSEVSLTLIVDDVARQRREAARAADQATPMDLHSWLNALQMQSAPMVHSRASREHLEAWMDEVDRMLAAGEDAEPAGLLAP